LGDGSSEATHVVVSPGIGVPSLESPSTNPRFNKTTDVNHLNFFCGNLIPCNWIRYFCFFLDLLDCDVYSYNNCFEIVTAVMLADQFGQN
jgi:hypothetical protein